MSIAPATALNPFQQAAWKAIGEIGHSIETISDPLARPLFADTLGQASQAVNGLYQLRATPKATDLALEAIDLIGKVADRYHAGGSRSDEGIALQLADLTAARSDVAEAFQLG